MTSLEGRVAIITGAGRGIGREHALLFAEEGAKVVINDLGGANDGEGSDQTPAEEVAAEIRALGGQAIANADDVASWEGAQRLVNAAITEFGDKSIKTCLVEIDGDDVRALGVKSAARGRTDAAGCAGDDGRASCNALQHDSPLSTDRAIGIPVRLAQ